MNEFINELSRLRENDPDVKFLLDMYEEIERIYRESLEVMGLVSKHTLEVANSSKVTISFRSVPLSAQGFASGVNYG